MKQAYILKKYVKAETAAEALALDAHSPVAEVILVEDKPKDSTADSVGFKAIEPED